MEDLNEGHDGPDICVLHCHSKETLEHRVCRNAQASKLAHVPEKTLWALFSPFVFLEGIPIHLLRHGGTRFTL